MSKVIVSLMTLTIAVQLNCEIFSAVDELDKLAVDEKTIIEEFRVLVNQVDDSYLREKLKAWQDEHSLVEKDVMGYITNPLNAYLLIKRATSDIDLIQKRYQDKATNFINKIAALQPTPADLEGAVDGLLRLMTMYKLHFMEFANGIVDGVKTRPKMSLHDLFVIGEQAYKLKNQDYFVKEYLNVVWDELEKGNNPNQEVDETAVLMILAESYNRTGEYDYALNVLDNLISKNPVINAYASMRNKVASDKERYGDTRLIQMNPYYDVIEKDGFYSEEQEEILYSQVCRGALEQTPKEKAPLRCKYVSNTPFSKLARFKAEEMNVDPYILLFYDVLSDAEIKILTKISKPQFERAATHNDDLSIKFSNIRVAQMACYLEEKHELVSTVSKRVEDMTGLNQNTSESLQIQNYGIGGHYEPHWDHIIKTQPMDKEGGNRIATVLLYMSDVEKGGATVFPYLKLRIPTKKGAAAFWYNLRVSGQDDYFTKHAGCPVLLGNKWVANKWIHDHGQEFRRPCIPETFVETSIEDYWKEFF